MRETWLGEKQQKRSQIRKVDPQLLRQLASIGNNQNQIARIMNQQSKANSAIDRSAVMTGWAGVERELKRLHDEHKNT